MSHLLTRAAALFVTPAASTSEREAVAPPRFAPRALVLGAPSEAPPVAAALGNELRRASRWPAALVAVWSPIAEAASVPADARFSGHTSPADAGHTLPADANGSTTDHAGAAREGDQPSGNADQPAGRNGATAPAHAAARRLATRLGSRGIPASARGRLAWLPLPTDPAPGIAMAERAAAATDVPAILTLAGPRPAEIEPVLSEHDLVVVVAGDDAGPLATLTLDRLTALPAPAVVVRPLHGASRRLALAGVGRLRALGDPSVRDAVRRPT
jgi:hypothetical protein